MKYRWLCIILTVFYGLQFAGKTAAFGVEAAEQEEKVVVAENSTDTAAISGAECDDADFSCMENKHIGNPESIEAGHALYGNTCLFCHGPGGVGARAPTLVSGGFAPGGVNDNEFFLSIIKYGRPDTIMGSFESYMSVEEMWQVIAYLRDEAEKKAQAE
jgi:cytochrome c